MVIACTNRCILCKNNDRGEIVSAFSQHGAILMSSAFKFLEENQKQIGGSMLPVLPAFRM